MALVNFLSRVSVDGNAGFTFLSYLKGRGGGTKPKSDRGVGWYFSGNFRALFFRERGEPQGAAAGPEGLIGGVNGGVATVCHIRNKGQHMQFDINAHSLCLYARGMWVRINGNKLFESSGQLWAPCALTLKIRVVLRTSPVIPTIWYRWPCGLVRKCEAAWQLQWNFWEDH
jgi:hypothetical protein